MMSLDCIRVSDAIWNSINEGVELTREELEHIQGCPSCADMLVDAQGCIDALGCVKPCPPAPDCRSVVLTRISRRRKWLAPAWACACAAVVIGVVVGGTLLRRDSSPQVSPPAPRVAKAPVAMPSKVTPKTPPPVPEVKLKPHASEPEMPQLPKPEVAHYVKPKPRVPVLVEPKPTPVPVEVAPMADSVEEEPEPVVTPPQEDSSALAYATWPTRSQLQESYEYSYTVTDPETGEVTECVVEVNVESSPVEPEAMPGKESKIDETVQFG